MSTFAFIVHPIDPKRDVARKFPWLARILPEGAIHFFSAYFPPVYLSRARGIVSPATGEELQGYLLACPLTAHRMRTLPLERAYRKIIQTGRLAQRLGADILGLGAFTSAIGDAGLTIAKALDIPVTTGDSYTVASAVMLAEEVAQTMGVPLQDLNVAVVGATGSIGRGVALLLASRVGHLWILARRPRVLGRIQEEIRTRTPKARVTPGTDLMNLRNVHLVISATSTPYAVLRPEHLRPGTVVIDMALPRDATQRLATHPEYLVLDGGLIQVPGPVDFGFHFGLPRKLAYACMAETMILALEKRFECYTLGKRIDPDKVEQMRTWAERHDFRLASWYSFGHRVGLERIASFRERFKQRLRLAVLV